MAVLVTCGFCQKEFRAKDQARGLTLKCPGCAKQLTVDGPRVSNHEVFISYSHKDKPVADAVCSAMENRKVRCWMAPRDIAPGSDWSASIIEAIEDAQIMLLLFSASSNMSQQVLREVERAVSKGLTVVPVRIESVGLSKSMEYFLSACHWIDAFSGLDDERLAGMASQLRLMLLKKGGVEPAAENKPVPITESGAAAVANPKLKQWWIVSAAVAAVVVIGGTIGVVAHFLTYGDRPAAVAVTNRQSAANGSSFPSYLPPAASSKSAPPAVREPSQPTYQPPAISRSSTGNGFLGNGSGDNPAARTGTPERFDNSTASAGGGRAMPGGGGGSVRPRNSGANQANKSVSPSTPSPVSSSSAATPSDGKLLMGPSDSNLKLQFLPGGQLLASGGTDTTHSLIWQVDSGAVNRRYEQPGNASFSSDGRWIYTSGNLIDSSNGRKIAIPSATANDVAAFNADGSRVAVGGAGRGMINVPVVVYESASGKQLFSTGKANGRTTHFDLSEDGKYLLAAGGDRGLTVWNVDTGQMMPRIALDTANRMLSLFSKDGTRVCGVNGNSGSFIVADIEKGKRLYVGASVNAPRLLGRKLHWLARDGFILATVLTDGSVTVVSIDDAGTRSSTVDVPGRAAGVPVFSDDGSKILIACTDGAVRLLAVDSGRELFAGRGEFSKISAVALSQDGRYAAAASDDHVVHVWKLPQGSSSAEDNVANISTPTPVTLDVPSNPQVIGSASTTAGNESGDKSAVPSTPPAAPQTQPAAQTAVAIVAPADALQAGSVWTHDEWKLQVLQRTADTAKVEYDLGSTVSRLVTVTVKDGKFSWLAKDVQAARGGAGWDTNVIIYPDKLDVESHDDKSHTSSMFLHRQASSNAMADGSGTSPVQTVAAGDDKHPLVPLFNGTNLDGWVIEDNRATTFHVDDGTILAVAPSDHNKNCLLSTKSYANFKLRLEYQCDQSGAGGIALRAVPHEKMVTITNTPAPSRPNGMNNQRPNNNNNNANTVVPTIEHPLMKIAGSGFFRGGTGALSWMVDASVLQANRAGVQKPQGTWNQMEIDVRDHLLIVTLNGNVIDSVEYTKSAKPTNTGICGLGRTSGRIGLFSAEGTIRYRNIEVQELP